MALNVFIILFLYSCAMFTLPFVAFFGAQHACSDYLFLENTFTINVVSVFSAVLVVNFIIILYAYQAFREPADFSEEKKDD